MSFSMDLEIRDFLAVREALFKWDSDACILVGANGSGKTQILDLIFTMFYASWRAKSKIDKTTDKNAFINTLRDVFLLRYRKDTPIIGALRNWQGKALHVNGQIITKRNHIIKVNMKETGSKRLIGFFFNGQFRSVPITYFSVLPLEYYRGIVALNTMSPKWRVIPFSKSEFIVRLFATYNDTYTGMPQVLKKSFEQKFGVSNVFIDNIQIKLTISGNTFSIERAASGLKGLASIYLAIKHGLINEDTELIIIDEPEVSLHPSWTYKFVEWLVEVMKHFRLKMLIATHSPLIIDSFNIMLKKRQLKRITVGTAKRSQYGFDWEFKDFDKDSLAEVFNLLNSYFDIVNNLYSA